MFLEVSGLRQGAYHDANVEARNTTSPTSNTTVAEYSNTTTSTIAETAAEAKKLKLTWVDFMLVFTLVSFSTSCIVICVQNVN